MKRLCGRCKKTRENDERLLGQKIPKEEMLADYYVEGIKPVNLDNTKFIPYRGYICQRHYQEFLDGEGEIRKLKDL